MAVVVPRYELCFILEGKMRLYIQHGAKLIVNQLDCLYRHFGANSDCAACFLICTSLISQQWLIDGKWLIAGAHQHRVGGVGGLGTITLPQSCGILISTRSQHWDIMTSYLLRNKLPCFYSLNRIDNQYVALSCSQTSLRAFAIINKVSKTQY
jgi:hypothetical protein